MSNIQLSMAMEKNPRTQALVTGTVNPSGIDLSCHTDLRGPSLFRYQLQTREFDVSEMSLTSVYMMIDRKDDSFVPVPVFTMRHFFHTTTLIREDSGIRDPSGLSGRRIGVPNYQSAASLWCRGAFEHEYGVSPFDVEWYTGQVPNGQSGEIPFNPPSELRLSIVDPKSSIDEMLLKGELDAYVNVTRMSPELSAQGSGIKRLFEDPRAEGIEYFRRTGIYPTNHCLVVKRDVADRYPWVPLSIFKACLASNLQSLVSPKILEPYVETGLLQPDIQGVLAQNLFGYGVESEAQILETFGQYCREQGYTQAELGPTDVFGHDDWSA